MKRKAKIKKGRRRIVSKKSLNEEEVASLRELMLAHSKLYLKAMEKLTKIAQILHQQ